MKTWIALFKGINVGGNNKILMKELVSEFQTLGFSEVRTYIQSGNVVFKSAVKDAETLAATISQSTLSRFGIKTQIIVLGKDELAKAAKANPFKEVQSDEDAKRLHLFFLAQPATQFDQARLDVIKKLSERWVFHDNIFYLHTPEGLGDSKLGMQVEKIVGVPVTARNWRTVGALLELANNLP